MMKYLVVLVVSAAVLLSVCDAACYRMLPQHDQNGCLYKGKLYELSSKWRTKNCMDCSCDSQGGLECCDAAGTPVDYDPDKCAFVFHKKTCTWNLIPNKDPTIKCEQYSMVG